MTAKYSVAMSDIASPSTYSASRVTAPRAVRDDARRRRARGHDQRRGERRAAALHVECRRCQRRPTREDVESGLSRRPSQLRLLHLRYVGFDGRSRVGTMVVNATVVTSVVRVFATLYAERFPIHLMVPESNFQGKDPASMAADNTSGFNCRYAVDDRPEAVVRARLRRGDRRQPGPEPLRLQRRGTTGRRQGVRRTDVTCVPGMAEVGGVLNDAFASVGWFWGGRWSASPDYQHFSSTGG